ncbi:MAG: hypothetical protein QOI98_2714 [Solirubrobacteraceae bacterium]|nr:hypothetical protein [Solirubrobacteraceae bacterium]
MLLTYLRRAALAAVLAMSLVAPAVSSAGPVPLSDDECLAPAGDPQPGTNAWRERDTKNQICATLRLRDQIKSPAFTFAGASQWPALHAAAAVEQATDPTHPRGGITTLIPGSRQADPFRTLARWTAAGRGTVTRVSFKALNGATLRGHVFVPPASVPKPASGYPGVVITDGSIQAYENLYFWAAEDLAAAGYVVMTYDVQGQGDSDLLGADCPTTCSGVPYQQNYNFYQGAEDSLSFFLSTPTAPFGGSSNPAHADLDPDAIGIAGHSLGAAAVSYVGQCDKRVKAIVAWDNLRAIEDCTGVTIPAQYRSDTLVHTPALGTSNDYAFNVQPTDTAPDPDAKQSGFTQLAAAGIDTAEVVFRGATHLEYTYIPYVLPASRLGERMASNYTVAWFDRYLRGLSSGFDRLVATQFDGSSDSRSIGAGDFSTDAATANPTDPTAGNIPYEIAGIPVANAVSFYYRSAYSLHDPVTNALVTCSDMRAGC